jgi:hypothetical protein
VDVEIGLIDGGLLAVGTAIKESHRRGRIYI